MDSQLDGAEQIDHEAEHFNEDDGSDYDEE